MAQGPHVVGMGSIMNRIALIKKKMALQSAQCLRACPPDPILFAPSPAPQTQRHLASCPLCRERRGILPEELEAWTTLGRQVFPPPEDAGNRQGPILPGEIRTVSKRCGGWAPGDRYYTPPLVLVLQEIQEPAPAFLVSQTYPDRLLMGPGDVAFKGTPGFAEPWNCYALGPADLSTRVGGVPKGILEAVLRKKDGPFDPIDPHTVLFAFRQLELALGAFVADTSLRSLLEGRDQTTRVLTLPFRDREALEAHIEENRLCIRLPEGPLPLEELLAFSDYPDAVFAMAAADEEGQAAKAVQVSPGGITPATVHYGILSREEVPKGMLILGKTHGPGFSPGAVHAWWVGPEGTRHRAREEGLSHEGGLFRLLFDPLPPGDRDKGTLVLFFIGKGHEG